MKKIVFKGHNNKRKARVKIPSGSSYQNAHEYIKEFDRINCLAHGATLYQGRFI